MCGSDADLISVDFIKWQRNNIVVVPSGEKRRKIYFSKWFLKNMRECYCERFNNSREISMSKFLQSIPLKFQAYFECRQNVLREDTKRCKTMNMQLLRNDTRLNEALVYLYSKKLDKELEDPFFDIQCAYALKKWLTGAGRFLSSGFNCGSKERTDMDLIPIIAAIGLMNEIKINGNLRLKSLSVHLARMLGYACGLSIHEEQIIRAWISRDSRKCHYSEQWNRLRHLSLGGEALLASKNGKQVEKNANFDGFLSPSQYEAIIENADSILRFNTWDMRLRNTVYALLLSIADLRDYSDFFRQMSGESYCTVRLAPIGRLLTPEMGRRNAFDELPDDIKSLLNDIFKKNTKCSIEFSDGIKIPLEDELRKYWNNEVDYSILLLNKFINLSKKNKR